MQVADGKSEYPVWNHWEFRVSYKSLQQQLCIGGIYVKLLMDGLDKVRVLFTSNFRLCRIMQLTVQTHFHVFRGQISVSLKPLRDVSRSLPFLTKSREMSITTAELK